MIIFCCYFLLQSKMKTGSQRGHIRLNQAQVTAEQNDHLSFTVLTHTKSILLKGDRVVLVCVFQCILYLYVWVNSAT